MKEKILTIIKKSSIFLMSFMTIILLYTTILWIFKIPTTKYHLPVEFIITIITFGLTNYWIYKKSKNNETLKKIIIDTCISIILGAVVFTISVYCVGKIYDTSADGNTYHKLAVGSMKNGWIPLYESCRDYTEEEGNVVTVIDGNRNYLWADHYAIGTEIIGANIYAFSNNIESGKAFSLVMMYICFGITLSYLCQERKLNLLAGMLISTVLVVNPITITQIGTYYVDTTLAMTLFMIIIELLSLTEKREVEKYLILGMSIAICSNAKFTGLAYAGVFCGVFYIYWLIENRKDKKQLLKRFKSDTLFYVITLVLTLGIIGGSSYLMNFVKHKSPFYPLYGEGHVENMVNQEIPESLSKKSNLEQFLISIFSKGKNVSPAYYKENIIEPELKVPLTISKEEIRNYTIPDIRMGGFGPLYSGAFILTCAVSFIAIVDFIKDKKYRKLTQYLLVVGISALLVIFLDGSYWARYIPYVYFITIINMIYLFEKKKLWGNIIGLAIGAILLLNSAVVLYAEANSYLLNSRYVKNNLEEFRIYAQQQETTQIKLNDIAYQGVIYNIDDLGIKVKINQEMEASLDGFMFKY